jgi:hypothetical protein
VSIDANGDRNADYSLLDMDPETGEFEVKSWWKQLTVYHDFLLSTCFSVKLIMWRILIVLIVLAPHRCGFDSQLWILSCEESVHRTYGTSMVLLRCPFVSEIMHGMVPEVFLHQ